MHETTSTIPRDETVEGHENADPRIAGDQAYIDEILDSCWQHQS